MNSDFINNLINSHTVVRAYIDPSAITYLIQIIAGLAIGGMTVFGVYWSKIKKAIKEALDIDLESKKEIESDDIHVKY